ncbi:unnamed protein product (macronuclear) [Paramecium tetraurelia]|uniref:Anaphase-promoting complex subunit 4 WD40 domain-containing protein n=1 Tax=Paramecium tetraurelia TaxID=5888 RepID=A0BKZ4_PARTE|nr:uncharacterized protein GSPATT00029842001 [Paramecium tetraurelia]CAK59211.1 unnamed protein product [Paramecium tetraurelia]|eukprot:XP_001426609.1 hypothetical protein (macronuclear) [Paramecium tetraurelia strain d4-2]
MPLCLHHQQPIAEITLIQFPTEELQLFCSKCPKSQDGSLEIVQILDRLSKIQIEDESNVENYLNFLSNRINAIKQEFLQVIESFSKQVKDQIKFFKQQIITPETINYYSSIQQFTSEDLKQLSTLFALNFRLDNHSFSYNKTNSIIQQQIIILHNKIKKVNQLKIQIENSFNPDYQTQSSIQTDEEDCFNEKPTGYKNYIEKDRIQYSQQIRGIEFSVDNQYVFAHSHELPLTAFKIVNNKLTAYQKLEQKSQNISSIACSKMVNRIYVVSDKYLEVYEENQQNHWTHIKQFEMLQTIHLIQISMSELIGLTLKNIVMLWPQQGNEERNKISLPQKHKKIVRSISFNYNSSFLLTACEDILVIWKISNSNQIEIYQCFENQSIIYAQFSDSVKNIFCAVNRFGNRAFWKPDIQGLFYEAQAIYSSSSTFGCTIKFRLNSKLIIIGNHSIQLFEEDQQNDNEWIVKQQIKVNCWNLDVSKDAKYIVADDFRNLCLYVREE